MVLGGKRRSVPGVLQVKLKGNKKRVGEPMLAPTRFQKLSQISSR